MTKRQTWRRGLGNTLRRVYESHLGASREEFIARGGPFLVTSLALGPTALDEIRVFELTDAKRCSGRIAITAGAKIAVDESAANRFTLGRTPDCDVVVPCQSVSKRHASFIERGGDWSILDLGSLNGTRLDGMDVQGEKASWITTTPARLDFGSDVTFFFVTRGDLYDFLIEVRRTTGETVPAEAPAKSAAPPEEVHPALIDDEVVDSYGNTAVDDDRLYLLGACAPTEEDEEPKDEDGRFAAALETLAGMGEGMVARVEASIKGSKGLVLTPGKGTTLADAVTTIRNMKSVVRAFRVTLALGGGEPIELYRRRS